MTRRTRPSRALRYGAGASALVLLVCALIAGLSGLTLGTVGARVSAATARGHGEVIHAAGHMVDIRWSPAMGTQPGVAATATLQLAVPAPAVGTRTEVAYDPRRPATVFIPGSTELAAVDRAFSGVVFSGLITAMVLATGSWQLISRRRLRSRSPQPVPVRRVRVQSGLLTRSWLELDCPPHRWIPVHFDPILVTLPAPVSLRMHGDPRRHRLVCVDVDGVWLHPSGPVRTSEPRGRRVDSPAHPDAETLQVAIGSGQGSWRRQLRADAALITPAPLVGLLWAFLDGGGVVTWACATALAAALALWWAALRGSDPS
ncbi:MAG: hypothetical protein ACRDTF_22405 [Pseudonocardiaceae bacterium]